MCQIKEGKTLFCKRLIRDASENSEVTIYLNNYRKSICKSYIVKAILTEHC